MTLTFEVPGEPRGKGRPRFVRKTGRAYTPAETVSYENLIRMVCKAELAGAEPLSGPVAVTIHATFQPPRSASKRAIAAMLAGQTRPTKKPDAENIAKCVLDAMNQVAFKDDAQVVFLMVSKAWGQTPGLIVSVGEYATAGTVTLGAAA